MQRSQNSYTVVASSSLSATTEPLLVILCICVISQKNVYAHARESAMQQQCTSKEQ